MAMTEFLTEYGLFVAKALTIVVAVGLIAAWIAALSKRTRTAEALKVKRLNDRYRDMLQALQGAVLPKHELRRALKSARKQRKRERKHPGADRKRMYVINFRGDIQASAVASLREEITAVLSFAGPDDEVLVRLENSGGLVHDHGLAASQLMRVKEKKLALTVAVDKVAASGGYMMACVADRILAAPFAVIGSIGVLAQLPNFHRLLDQHGVDFEQIKAGQYKRTVTMFGKNTDDERAKMREEVEDVHELFKDHVARHRPSVDIAKVATGEHWHGIRALELKLVDELTTSDDYLLAASENTDLYEVSYVTRKPLARKLATAVQQAADGLALTWWRRARESRFIS
jgi:serine protease SohB